MKPLPTPSRQLTLDALLARRRPFRPGGAQVLETCMPDDAEPGLPRERAGSQMGRIAAEVALEEGGRRHYAPRGESQVLERR